MRLLNYSQTPCFFGVFLSLSLLLPASDAGANDCVRGQPCGRTCISWDKVCHVGTPAAPNYYHDSEPLQAATPEARESGPATSRIDSQIDSAINIHIAGRNLAASITLFDIAYRETNASESDRGKALYYLGRSLEGAGFPIVALRAYNSILKLGPSNPYFKYALPRIYATSSRFGDRVTMLSLPDKYDVEEFPRRARVHTYSVLALRSVEAGQYEDALTFIENALSLSSSAEPKLEILRGHALGSLGRYVEATAAYALAIDSIRGESGASTRREWQATIDVAHVNSARSYSCAEMFNEAVKEYRHVSKSSRHYHITRHELRLSAAMRDRRWPRRASGKLGIDSDAPPAQSLFPLITAFYLGDESAFEREAAAREAALRRAREHLARVASFLTADSLDPETINDVWADRHAYFLPPWLGDQQRAFMNASPRKVPAENLQREVLSELERLNSLPAAWTDSGVGENSFVILQSELVHARARELIAYIEEWGRYIDSLSKGNRLAEQLLNAGVGVKEDVAIPCFALSTDAPFDL